MDILDAQQIKPDVLRWIGSWHGQQSYLLPFVTADVLPSGISSGTVSPFTATIPSGLTVVSWLQTCYVATTNSASAYWTIALYRFQTSAVKIAEIDTSRMSASTWTRLSLTVSAAVPSTDLLLYIYVTKTGSPGNLSLAGPMVWVR